MSMINYASREINCKLVYYGPGLGGKTTNLEHVYQKVGHSKLPRPSVCTAILGEIIAISSWMCAEKTENGQKSS